MKRNGGAERDRCIIERSSRNRIITSPFEMCYRHRVKLKDKRYGREEH